MGPGLKRKEDSLSDYSDFSFCFVLETVIQKFVTLRKFLLVLRKKVDKCYQVAWEVAIKNCWSFHKTT